MILALIVLLLYKFKFVNCAVNGQCDQNMMAVSLNACRNININVYQPVPDNDDTFESFLSAAAGTITGEIPILGSIIQWGADNLIKAGAASSGGPSQEYIFQSKVNEAFKQMSSCIDQKIDSRLAEEARKNFNAVGSKFIEIRNSLKSLSISSNPIGQALLIGKLIIDFQSTMDNIRQLIKQYFIISKPQTYNYYLYNLPVFEEAALLYNQIYSSYAASLKKVPGQISDPTFKQYYDYAISDAAILTKWIQIALQTIQWAYTLNGHENVLLNAPLTISKGSYGINDDGNIVLGVVNKAAMVANNPALSPVIGVSLELNSLALGKIVCVLSGVPGCNINVNSESQCLGILKTTMTNFVNQYQASTTTYISTLARQYYAYTSKINYKLANIKTKYNL